jgi:membrane protein DedA with SNARE-associated domain
VTLLTTYGYWAVFACFAIESTGIPFPGETMLLVAAIYAGSTHQLAPVLVIVAAESFAILGDNLGFWVGREGGYRLLRRYGHLVHLNEGKLKLGLYLFRRHGGKVVFFGRFVAVLRMWAAFLARTNRMAWKRFLLFNALGGIMWASLVGLGGYFLGDAVHRLTGPVGIGAAVLAGLLSIAFFLFLRTHQHRLEEEAERALPGPLDDYRKAPRGERQSRLLAGQTPGRTERSHQRIGEEQPTVLVCETFDRGGQAFAPWEQQASTRSHTGEAEKHSARKIVFHKIMLVKETVVHE